MRVWVPMTIGIQVRIGKAVKGDLYAERKTNVGDNKFRNPTELDSGVSGEKRKFAIMCTNVCARAAT